MDAYIAEALQSTGTRKAPKTDGPPVAAARPAPATTPPPPGRPRTASASPHSVVARTSSPIRTPDAPVVGRAPTPNAAPSNAGPAVGRAPTPNGLRARTSSVPPTFDDSPLASIDRARRPTPPPPAVARTRSASASPLAIARARDLAMVEPLPHTRAPHASSTQLPQVDELDSDFGDDTVPDMTAVAALTDQDDRGVRRS